MNCYSNVSEINRQTSIAYFLDCHDQYIYKWICNKIKCWFVSIIFRKKGLQNTIRLPTENFSGTEPMSRWSQPFWRVDSGSCRTAGAEWGVESTSLRKTANRLAMVRCCLIILCFYFSIRRCFNIEISQWKIGFFHFIEIELLEET